ncbi:phosphoenolpyruvate synthase [Caerostris extrusa]|uniref:Phosphoenolpyruvate synthase n=1 Tax=Caerostris extrusa TaxID=172846 RepID=A0AAV4PH18_CAEEX|nr:phosphoenolpyruvate synthase [Caerostris extrusa]
MGGILNNNLYIFQSRPVTSGTEETDFEIDHEFDAGLRCENDYFTMCNVWVIMPGATSPLGLEVLMKFFNIAFQRRVLTVGLPKSRLAKYFLRGIVSMYYHVMFYCVDLFQHIKEDASRTQATSVGLFGRIIEDEELFEIARERFANSQLKKDSSFKESLRRMYRVLFGSKRYLNRTIKNYAGYHVNDDKCVDSRQLYDRLLYSCTELTPVMVAHMFCSESSSLLNMIIFITLQKATGEINADVYNDFARLLTTSSGVESADVPAAMEHLAFCIFKTLNQKNSKTWKLRKL